MSVRGPRNRLRRNRSRLVGQRYRHVGARRFAAHSNYRSVTGRRGTGFLTQVFEFLYGLERDSGRDNSDRQLIDPVGRHVAQELCCLRDVRDALRQEAHQPDTDCISRYGIVRENDLVEPSRGSRQRAIAFHADNSISDHKMNGHRRYDIDNALLNAAPVQEVLGLPILHTRHHSEHVLHA